MIVALHDPLDVEDGHLLFKTPPDDLDKDLAMTTSSTPRIWPTLLYADARAAINFLERALGFTTTLVVPNPDDDSIVEHCQMNGPEGGGIMLGTANRPGNKFSQRPIGGSSSVYVVVAQIDDLYERAVAAGAEIFHEIEDQDYGSRDFSVLDPEGNTWSFGTYGGETQLPG